MTLQFYFYTKSIIQLESPIDSIDRDAGLVKGRIPNPVESVRALTIAFRDRRGFPGKEKNGDRSLKSHIP